MTKAQAKTLASLIVGTGSPMTLAENYRLKIKEDNTDLKLKIFTQDSEFTCMIDYEGNISDKAETRRFDSW